MDKKLCDLLTEVEKALTLSAKLMIALDQSDTDSIIREAAYTTHHNNILLLGKIQSYKKENE